MQSPPVQRSWTGSPRPRFCFNHPDYRTWHLSIVEDYVQSYDLDGILLYLFEREENLRVGLKACLRAA